MVEGRHRHHRRCDDPPRAVVDQEQGRPTRPGDAPGEEGQPVVLRHEGACGCGCRNQADPLGGGDGGQRGRQPHAGPTAARRRNRDMGRSGLSGSDGSPATTRSQAIDRTNRRWRTKLKSYLEVREQNCIQSKTRSRVEHVFALVKLKFGFTKVRSRQPRDRTQTSAGSLRAQLRLKTDLERSKPTLNQQIQRRQAATGRKSPLSSYSPAKRTTTSDHP